MQMMLGIPTDKCTGEEKRVLVCVCVCEAQEGCAGTALSYEQLCWSPSMGVLWWFLIASFYSLEISNITLSLIRLFLTVHCCPSQVELSMHEF